MPQLRPKPDAIAPEIRRNCVGIQPQLRENQPQLRENQPQLRDSQPRNCVGAACDLRRKRRARALCVRAQCIVRRCAVRCASVRRIAVARRELPVAGGRGRWQWTLRRPPVPFTCAIAKGPRWSRRWRHGERGRGRLRREARARGPRARAPRARAPRAAPKGEDGHPRRRAAGAAHQGRAAQARRAPREAGHPQMAWTLVARCSGGRPLPLPRGCGGLARPLAVHCYAPLSTVAT